METRSDGEEESGSEKRGENPAGTWRGQCLNSTGGPAQSD